MSGTEVVSCKYTYLDNGGAVTGDGCQGVCYKETVVSILCSRNLMLLLIYEDVVIDIWV